MSIVFLLMAYLIPTVSELSILMNVLMEGLFIGGWVLLWEAFAIFFFNGHELRIKRKLFVKFLDSEIKFKNIK